MTVRAIGAARRIDVAKVVEEQVVREVATAAARRGRPTVAVAANIVQRPIDVAAITRSRIPCSGWTADAEINALV